MCKYEVAQGRRGEAVLRAGVAACARGDTFVKRLRVHAGEVRILVIDDDDVFADAVAVGLRRARMAVDVALDGRSGLEAAIINDYDVVVLDRDLPGLHGDAVCAELVAAGRRCRVLMLTAAGTMNDLVDGLALGADDYLPKPFDFPVLVARIGALARRAQPAHPPVLHIGDITVDTAGRVATRNGRILDLTPKEFGVLELLTAAQGRTVSTEELLERVWDDAADPFTTAVKITVSRLRTKLGEPGVIGTVSKAGYRLAL
jgi:DNA-binding response OmpR family regulator